MQSDKPAGTVIFVANRSPETAVAQDIETYGLIWQWASTIREAVGLLSLVREKAVIVTELALADGNWRDLVERVKCIGISTSVVLITSCSTAELWWDALDCGVDDILHGGVMGSRLFTLMGTQGELRQLS